MAHEYNPNVKDEGDPELIRAEAEYQNKVLDEQVAQRWVMVYGFILGFIVLSVLLPWIRSVTGGYPQVYFFAAALVTAIALFTATKSREKWATILAIIATLLMLFAVVEIDTFGAHMMLAIDPPEGVDPGNLASELEIWLGALGFVMLILFAIAWQAREWVVQGRRWFIRFALIWSVFMLILSGGFFFAVLVMG